MVAALLLLSLTTACADAMPPADGVQPVIDAGDADAGSYESEPPADACAVAEADRDNTLAAGACRAIGPFARDEFHEPFDLLLGDVTARRFNVAALSQLWPSYQQALALMPDSELSVYARVGDASEQVTLAELSMLGSVDAYTGPALHCREHPLPRDFAATLTTNLALGGYSATPVLLALIWLRDGACSHPADDPFVEATVAAAAALIDSDHSMTTDLEMEAAAFLTYFGEGNRVPAGFVEGVLTNQQPDGGWGPMLPDDAASGHTSGLALWFLHELLFPGRKTPMVNPYVRAPPASAS